MATKEGVDNVICPMSILREIDAAKGNPHKEIKIFKTRLKISTHPT
jgi:hypothetical protein